MKHRIPIRISNRSIEADIGERAYAIYDPSSGPLSPIDSVIASLERRTGAWVRTVQLDASREDGWRCYSATFCRGGDRSYAPVAFSTHIYLEGEHSRLEFI